MKKLTIEQALASGYTLCGYAGVDWQSAMDISDMTAADLENPIEKIVLFSKEFTTPPCDSDYIKELLADRISDNWEAETGDDTGEVLGTIMAMDFRNTATELKKALETHKAYKLTDIELIP